MTDAEKLKTAINLTRSGDKKAAARLLFPAYQQMSDPHIKLQSILALMASLNPLTDMDKMALACENGILLAKSVGDDEALTYLLGEKASQLGMLASMLSHMQKNLKLAPGWFNFATEKEKAEYDRGALSQEMGLKESEKLFKEALEMAEKSTQSDMKARILLMIGQDYGSKYLLYKAEHMVMSRRFCLKITNRLFWIRRFSIDNYLMLTGPDRKALGDILNQCRESYLKAAKIYQDIGQESDMAYAYYNLAVQIRSAYRFREVERYIRKAEVIAKKHNDLNLIKSIEGLKEDIKSRNKNIPDYLEGETRDNS